MKLEQSDSIYVLGDDSFLYLILDRPAPPHINLYNQSLAYAQQQSVDWIDKHRPKFVFWRDSFKEFDGIPNITRAPIVYDAVIENYLPHTRIGNFEVLRRKNDGETPDIGYWTAHLGNELDLGFIPSRHSLPVTARGYNMRTMLEVEVKHPVHGKTLKVPFRIGTSDYFIAMRERAGVNHYIVPLDRIWFWNAAEKMQLAIQPGRSPNEKEMKFQIEKRPLAQSILY